MNIRSAIRPVTPLEAFVASKDLPWIASTTPGKSAKPLRFLDDRGFVELLRMEPGTTMPLHRHTGEVQVYQISGLRQLDNGQVMGPGDYILEPAGNVDWWKVVGDEPMLAFVVVLGEVEFLGPGGEVRTVVSAASQRDAYLRHCMERGLPPQALG